MVYRRVPYFHRDQVWVRFIFLTPKILQNPTQRTLSYTEILYSTFPFPRTLRTRTFSAKVPVLHHCSSTRYPPPDRDGWEYAFRHVPLQPKIASVTRFTAFGCVKRSSSTHITATAAQQSPVRSKRIPEAPALPSAVRSRRVNRGKPS